MMKKLTSILVLLAMNLFMVQAQVILVSSVAPDGASWLRVDEGHLTVNFTADKGTVTIPVETNLAYTCTSDYSWCTVTGTTTSGVTVSVEANTTSQLRTAQLTLLAKDNHTVTITVNQLGTSPAILVKEKAVEIANDVFDFTLEVTTNVDVQFTLPEWITMQTEVVQGTTVYAFRAAALEEAHTSRTGEIVIADKAGVAPSVSVSVKQDFSGYPRFAVISDTHFGNSWNEGPMVKVPKALKNLISKSPRIDAIFICGDLTDWGKPEQYKLFQQVFDDRSIVPADLPVYVMMGNHDNYADNALQNYLVLNQPYHQLIDIKGYPFITTSMNGGGWNDYAPEEVAALAQNLKIASEKYPGKPIFVFTHVPPKNTVYGTCDGEGGWGSNILTATLSKYPQVIIFGGHSHFPVGDPRSIHQGVFTTVNDGSTTYSEIEPGVVNEGIHPDKAGYVTEGCIVNVDKDMNVEIERWDTYRNEEMLPRWTVKAPHDGSQFVYTSDRTGGEAPKWTAGSTVTVSDVQNEGCKVTFPQAVDDENVHHYVVELVSNGSVVAKHSIFSGFYLNSDMPETLTVKMEGVPDGLTMTARVIAWDSYKNTSEPLESEPFTTVAYEPDPGTEKPVADLFDIQFNKNGQATDISERHINVRSGSSVPTTYLNETYNLWTASFAGSNSSFYRVDYAEDEAIKNAFSNGFTFEVFYKTNNTSNVCPMSAQESGGAGIEQASGGQIQFYCHVGGSYKTLKSSVTVETGKFYHVVAVYDKAAAKTRIYVNGSPAGEMNASGNFGFPSKTDAHWIAIGGDANPSGNAQFALNGDVMVARMYGKAVDRDEVYWMYKELKDRRDNYQPLPGTEVPVAGLLDVQFGENGVSDASAHGSEIKVGSTAPTAAYDETYKMWGASFSGSGNCYYRVDYAADQTIRDAFTNGFAMEAFYKCNTLKTTNVFSSQEGGGAGFEQSSGNELQFWCHVGGGYKTIKSGIKAEVGKYYHVVAIYDKEAAKVRMYVNGMPAGEVAASGAFGFPKDVAQWIGIGADPQTDTNGQNGLDGMILVARMYERALTRDEVYVLYQELEKRKEETPDEPEVTLPVAGVLDATFNADGTVTDASAHQGTFTVGSVAPVAYYDEVYGMQGMYFTGNNSCYYRMDYAEDQTVLDAFANGFSMEAFYRNDGTGTRNVFSSQQSGGAGIEQSSSNVLEFWCPTTEGKSSVSSGMKVAVGEYYHVVGVYNKEAGKIIIYVNGEKAGEANAAGDFKLPSNEANRWLAIGADPYSSTAAQNAFAGVVLTARIYEKALSDEEIAALYADLEKRKEENLPDLEVNAPVADLLDVEFGEGGTAKDVSASEQPVLKGTVDAETYYNETYGRYAAKFSDNSDCFYRVDYDGNEPLMNAFSNAFTYEVLYKPTTLANDCPMSAQESGGAGIEQAGNGQIQFYCRINDNWVTIKGKVSAEAGKFYHVLATYDKTTGWTRLFVNGELAGELPAQGEFTFPTGEERVKARWICIGGDAGVNGVSQYSLNGEVVLARMYSKAVSRDEAAVLYKALNK